MLFFVLFPASCEYCVSECMCVSAGVINLVGGGAEQLRYQVTQGNTVVLLLYSTGILCTEILCTEILCTEILCTRIQCGDA